jgi:hypothetical protein
MNHRKYQIKCDENVIQQRLYYLNTSEIVSNQILSSMRMSNLSNKTDLLINAEE